MLEWRAAGASVRGAVHQRGGSPNQDAVRWAPAAGSDIRAAVAVADGHGSVRCFRSDTGARFAVSIGLVVLSDLLATEVTDGDADALGHQVVTGWHESVRADLERRPITDDELDRLESALGPDSRVDALASPVHAYGTTLLLAGVNPEHLVLMQVGDGDILTVSADGEVARPLPPDPRSDGNETASLIRPAAWKDARLAVGRIEAGAPALLLAATDGYANSFATDDGFLQVGPDLLGLVRSEGLEAVQADLEPWLAEASQLGSGDDVTVGLLVANG